MLRRYLWPTVLILSTALVFLTQALNLPVVSPLVMAWFLLLCPGLAIAQLLPIKPLSNQIGLAFALSIALSTLLAEFMAFTHLWSPDAVLWVLAGLTISCALLQVRALRQAGRIGERPEQWQHSHASNVPDVLAHLLAEQPVATIDFTRPALPQAETAPHFMQQMYYRPKRHLTFNRASGKSAH